jgi:hypothetical protein
LLRELSQVRVPEQYFAHYPGNLVLIHLNLKVFSKRKLEPGCDTLQQRGWQMFLFGQDKIAEVDCALKHVGWH